MVSSQLRGLAPYPGVLGFEACLYLDYSIGWYEMKMGKGGRAGSHELQEMVCKL